MAKFVLFHILKHEVGLVASLRSIQISVAVVVSVLPAGQHGPGNLPTHQQANQSTSGVFRQITSSLVVHPDYILNVGNDGLPSASEQPSWLQKKDILAVDGRRKDAVLSVVRVDGGTSSLLVHPDYILNAGNDGLPLASEQPSWLQKKDILVVDARRKDAVLSVVRVDGGPKLSQGPNVSWRYIEFSLKYPA